MSTSAPVAAGDNTVPNLQKDEVTGEMVSKSELKKRIKSRAKDEAKAVKVSYPSLVDCNTGP